MMIANYIYGHTRPVVSFLFVHLIAITTRFEKEKICIPPESCFSLVGEAMPTGGRVELAVGSTVSQEAAVP